MVYNKLMTSRALRIKFILKIANALIAFLVIFPLFIFIAQKYSCSGCQLGFLASVLLSASQYLLFFQTIIVMPVLIVFFIPFSVYVEWNGKQRERKITFLIMTWLILIVSLVLLFG